MHQKMMELQTHTGIWKEMDEGSGGCSDVSTRKTIKRSLEGSTKPKVVSRDLFSYGHEWITSGVNMAVGDCAKSSTILYLCVARLEVALRCDGPLGILGISSTLG